MPRNPQQQETVMALLKRKEKPQTNQLEELIEQAGIAKDRENEWKKRYSELRSEIDTLVDIPEDQDQKVSVDSEHYTAIKTFNTVKLVDARKTHEFLVKNKHSLLDLFWRSIKVNIIDFERAMPGDVLDKFVEQTKSDVPTLTIRTKKANNNK